MTAYQRTQILLEPEQHATLTKLAAQEKRSLSEIIREFTARFLAERDAERKRKEAIAAIERMASFREKMAARATDPIPDVVEVLNEMRDERVKNFERIWRGEE